MTLLEQAHAGNRDAFTALVARYQAPVFRYLRTLTRTPQEAEDALQQTFLAVWRSLLPDSGAGKRGEGSVRAWLFTIARHAAYRQGRRHAGEPDTLESLESLGERAGWGEPEDPERVAMLLEDRERLHAALARLSDDDREVILLRDVEGLSGEDAARVLDLPLANLKTRLHRARLRLRAALQQEVRHEG
ncbi:MAG: RNA polymerase sigma factor [Myxococcota bacterium]